MQIQFQKRKIYLDTCSIGRSLDNQAQDRIRRETEAVETIVDYFLRVNYIGLPAKLWQLRLRIIPI